MSGLPPYPGPEDPGSPPPPQYVGYTRPGMFFGDPDRLQALSDGYFGLNLAFIATIVLAVGSRVLILALATVLDTTLAIVLTYLVTITAVALICHPYNKKIGYGAGWNESSATVASVLMGLNVLCCGIIGFIVMQSLAAKEIKKFGVKSGVLGFRKRDIQAAIAHMRASHVPPAPMAPPTGYER